MKTHSLKTWPEYFEAILDGRKKFEFRRDDRAFCPGDVLRLREFDPEAGRAGTWRGAGYTGREIIAKVTYLLADRFGVPDGYCVMSIAPDSWTPDAKAGGKPFVKIKIGCAG